MEVKDSADSCSNGNNAEAKTIVQEQPATGKRGKKGKKTKYRPLDLSSVPDLPPAASTNTAAKSSQHQARNSWDQQPRQQYQSAPRSGYSETRKDTYGYGQKQREYQHAPRDLQYNSADRDSFALSKALVTLLRHKKPSDILVDSYGFAKIDSIVAHHQFKRFNTSSKEIQNIVASNDKRRFEIEEDSEGNLQIRAVQGHSFKLDTKKSGLIPLTDPSKFQTIVHGTYEVNWRRIKKEGLNRMNRQHIHFSIGHIGESHVTSGMRADCEIVIELDLKKALEGGLKLFISTNNVVLTEGDESGIVHPKYFKPTIRKWNYKTNAFETKEFNYSEFQ